MHRSQFQVDIRVDNFAMFFSTFFVIRNINFIEKDIEQLLLFKSFESEDIFLEFSEPTGYRIFYRNLAISLIHYFVFLLEASFVFLMHF